MKKILSLMVMSLMVIIPFSVDAATSINVNCENDGTGLHTCIVPYSTTEILDTLSVTITEYGGAEVTDIRNMDTSDWLLAGSPTEANNVWTVNLSSVGVDGEGDLFTFQYQDSGQEDCKVAVSLGDITVTPDEPDEPSEEVQTGATLPYIALGAVALIAAVSYIATKNKSKMYKI